LFDFRNALRNRTYVAASGVFVESISHAEMDDSFGVMQHWGKPGEKRKHGKASVRELEARQRWDSLIYFCQPGSHDGGRGLTCSSTMARNPLSVRRRLSEGIANKLAMV